MNKRIMYLSILADICLLIALVYYFGVTKGIILMIISMCIGAVSGALVQKYRNKKE
jgi:Na+-translocating ferredoxin:NAD+ oxidoreductase RnfD subunit